MSESLRNDGRIWVPKKLEDAKALQAGTKKPNDIPDEDRDFYLERRYPAFGNLVPRDVASRAAKSVAMLASVLTTQVSLYSLTSSTLSSASVRM